MGALFVVVADPQIEIDLQLVDRTVQLFAERDPINSLSRVLWKRSQMPFVCGLLVLVREWSISSIAKDKARIRAAQDCRNTRRRGRSTPAAA
jgi:hypothetical protein